MLTVFPHLGFGRFSPPRPVIAPGTLDAPLRATVLDVDGDGELDIAAAAPDASQIVVLWGGR